MIIQLIPGRMPPLPSTGQSRRKGDGENRHYPLHRGSGEGLLYPVPCARPQLMLPCGAVSLRQHDAGYYRAASAEHDGLARNVDTASKLVDPKHRWVISSSALLCSALYELILLH